MRKDIKNQSRVVSWVITGLLSFFCYSCNIDNGDFVKFSELGAVNNTYTVEAPGGSVEIQVYSNETYDIYFEKDVQWASLLVSKMTGDDTLTVNYDDNLGFPRMVNICLFSPESSRYDTITLKQKGVLEPKMNFAMTSTTVLGGGGQVSAKLETNLDMNDVEIKATYTGEEQDWINEDFALQGDNFTFTVGQNHSETSLRNARVVLTYTDGWGEKVSSTLNLTQANALDKFGEEITFSDVRFCEGTKITSDVYIEGYVVSDAGNPNVADVPNTTQTVIDYTTNNKTVYIQSADGQYGFRVITAAEGDNIFTRYSKVQLLLKGTSVVLDKDPDCYTITGVTSSMLMTSTSGIASDLPKKEKYMSELTDNDIYTYVTLKNCELPVRKGALTPINEGYSTLFNANRIGKYPLLMRDVQGNSMFLMTNTKCTYRRDGSILPQGSGKISGVIVHERFVRFEYQDTNDEDTYGYIGRYQIRHLTRSDIEISDEFDNGFSNLLTEYRYPNISNGVQYPTTGNNGYIKGSLASISVVAASDYSYLGPCGSTYLGNKNQYGTGVLVDGQKQNTSTSTNSDGKGGATLSGFGYNCKWWNSELGRGEYWLLKFSTSGISTNQFSLQFTTMNWAVGGPRYWDLEWSTHGTDEGIWTYITSYTVPDVVQWSNTLLSQSCGLKNINVPLPLEMLGKSEVYLRFRVARNITGNGSLYTGVPIENLVSNGFGYLAIRYNK